ncbi:hypothetical protein CH63R_02939 [Colletotrichum higginsianum IMI 349063]|uniref:Uncharacterized protein n=1 Tax=Colletotrichum higginsianum (strain IMI 349063) TaxID=759273 RepID=A0A1B7YQC5_COLHI|nr:hypothetical protein CH63R_02939 [Colletotrichum higginsianum IMI 349063]OBR14213.1 hypothetical protein CH63R_02939 [Colletotrichum higginsianum IMI 349063]
MRPLLRTKVRRCSNTDADRAFVQQATGHARRAIVADEGGRPLEQGRVFRMVQSYGARLMRTDETLSDNGVHLVVSLGGLKEASSSL